MTCSIITGPFEYMARVFLLFSYPLVFALYYYLFLLLIIQTGGPVAKAHVCKQKDLGSIPGPSVLLFSQRLHAYFIHYASRRTPCSPTIQPMDSSSIKSNLPHVRDYGTLSRPDQHRITR